MFWIILIVSVLEGSAAVNTTACSNFTCPNATSVCKLLSDGTPFCSCYFGFRGVACDVDVDECRMGHPCMTTGRCVNTFGSYRCTCLSGWKGVHCEIRNPSEPLECLVGWKGPNCTDDVNECTEISDDPCSPNGNCKNKPGSYSCDCNIGWKGQNCTLDIDECLGSPCQNGGHCSNSAGSYSCACLSPWFGLTCNTSQCSSRPCQNGGVCLNIGVASYSCKCSTPWAGQKCDFNTTCSYNPCKNGGTCSNDTGRYVCTCAGIWGGKLCDVNTTRKTADDNDAPDLAVIIGASIGTVLCVCGISGGAALIWWIKKGRKVEPGARITVLEVDNTVNGGGPTMVPGCQKITDIVMRTRFSLRQSTK